MLEPVDSGSFVSCRCTIPGMSRGCTAVAKVGVRVIGLVGLIVNNGFCGRDVGAGVGKVGPKKFTCKYLYTHSLMQTVPGVPSKGL